MIISSQELVNVWFYDTLSGYYYKKVDKIMWIIFKMLILALSKAFFIMSLEYLHADDFIALFMVVIVVLVSHMQPA